MKVLMIGLVLALATVEIEKTQKAGQPKPPGADPRDESQPRFSLEIEFSRVWESNERIRRFARQGGRPRSARQDDLGALLDRFESSGQSSDPLHVLCRVDCTMVQPGGWLAVLNVVGIVYRDLESRPAARIGGAPPDRSWRID